MNNFPLAVLISGGGTTLKNLLHWQALGELPVEIRVVISSNPTAGGMVYAREAEIPVEVVRRKDFADPIAHSEAMFSICRNLHVQLVVMAGYLEHLLIPNDFSGRVINIHPALIPAFSGKGFYGERVHQAAIDYGVKLSGCTVHYVDNEYDHGPIIAQRACPLLPGDTSQTLQRRVFELECQLLPEVIRAISRQRITLRGRNVTSHEII